MSYQESHDIVQSTKLSSKGQVIIPKTFRSAYHWEVGQELIVIDTGDGLLLKSTTPFTKSNINEVAGCLKYTGTAKTLEEMEKAVAQGIEEQFHDCD